MLKIRQTPVFYNEARDIILQSAQPLENFEVVELKDSPGRVLAEDIYSDTDIPGADNSSMDGYCVKSNLLQGACKENPVVLPVVSGIDAGHKIDAVPDGHCAYVATGGILPGGVDTIIRIEETRVSEDGTMISFLVEAKPGNFIRPKASELSKGDLLVPNSTYISPFVAGQIASSGKIMVPVKRKPVVAVLTSGDEIIMPWEYPKPWQVRNSNSIMLCAQAKEAGATVFDAGIARDTGDHAKQLFLHAIEAADVVITSGGISMGRKDPFKNVFAELGIKPEVYGIKMKPGKPLFFGHYKNKAVFGLPGNQVSSSVTFEIFVRPYLQKLLGLAPFRLEANITLSGNSFNDSGRDFFKRGQIIVENGDMKVKQLESQESHMLTSLSGADVLFLHPTQPENIASGQKVKCFFLKG